jgi:hypothetical protein
MKMISHRLQKKKKNNNKVNLAGGYQVVIQLFSPLESFVEADLRQTTLLT